MAKKETKSKQGAPLEEQSEVKISLPESEVRQLIAAFGLRMPEAVARDIYFFDTPGFTLSDAGLVLRARKTADKPDDVTVKLRPMKRSEIASKWLSIPGLKNEIDVIGKWQVESCSLTCAVHQGKIDHVVIGKEQIQSLFSSVQYDLIAQYARLQPEWGTIQAFGPIQARIWKVPARDFDEALTVELWRLPNNRRLMELSYKAPISEVADVQRGLDAFIASKGFQGVSDGDTKTRLAVRFFKGERSPEP
jgi:hypothetical protein